MRNLTDLHVEDRAGTTQRKHSQNGGTASGKEQKNNGNSDLVPARKAQSRMRQMWERVQNATEAQQTSTRLSQSWWTLRLSLCLVLAIITFNILYIGGAAVPAIETYVTARRLEVGDVIVEKMGTRKYTYNVTDKVTRGHNVFVTVNGKTVWRYEEESLVEVM